MPISIDIQSHWGSLNCKDVTKKKKKALQVKIHRTESSVAQARYK